MSRHSLTTILTIFMVGAMIGFIASGFAFNAKLEKDGRYDSIELQHQVMMEHNEYYNYCPYCGEKLEKER